MNGGILPILMICATVGLALSLVDRRDAFLGITAIVLSAVLVSIFKIAPGASKIVFAGLFLSTIFTAILIYLPRSWPHHWALPVTVNAGGWAGALASLSGMHTALWLALPLCLICLPGRWIEQRGLGIAVKVAASWMIAISSLALFVSMMPHPGYVPDHME
ncbi:MAG: hypothetical protein ABIN83_00550 [Sphingomicrobium sp.]